MYVFWQPRAIPKQYDGLSKDEYDETVLIRQSLRAPWWEQPEGGVDEQSEAVLDELIPVELPQ